MEAEEAGTASASQTVQLERVSNGRMRLVVAGALDAAGVSALEAAVLEVMSSRPRRLELDLTQLTGCPAAGVAAVADCLSLGRDLADGVGVSVATDAGRRALLGSMARV